MLKLAPLITILVLICGGRAYAQDLRDFCGDRPGRATPPCILDAGHTQVEVGLADAVFLRGSGQHETITVLGATEVRFGLTPRLEAELAWAPVIVDHDRGAANRTGSGDLMLGLRTSLTKPGGEGWQVSLQGFVNAPTATHGLGAGGWTGGVRMPMATPLGNGLTFGVVPEVDLVRNAGGGGTHALVINAVSLARAFGKTTLGVEAWGAVNDDPAGRSYQATADIIAARLIGENLQLDAGANFGLNRTTPDVEVYVGVSRRF